MAKLTIEDIKEIFNLREDQIKWVEEKNTIHFGEKEDLENNLKLLESLGLNIDEIMRFIPYNNISVLWINSNIFKENLLYLKERLGLEPIDICGLVGNNTSSFIGIPKERIEDRLNYLETAVNVNSIKLKYLACRSNALSHSNCAHLIISHNQVIEDYNLDFNQLNNDVSFYRKEIADLELVLKIALLSKVNPYHALRNCNNCSPSGFFSRFKAWEHGELSAKYIFSHENDFQDHAEFSTYEFMRIYPYSKADNYELDTEFEKTFPEISNARINRLSRNLRKLSPPRVSGLQQLSMEYLVDFYEISNSTIAYIFQTRPRFFSIQYRPLIDKNIQLLRVEHGITYDEMKQIVNHAQGFLLYPTRQIDDLCTYLKQQFYLSNRDLVKVITKNKNIMDLKIDRIDRYIIALRCLCGFDDRDIKNLLIQNPMFGFTSPERFSLRHLLLTYSGINKTSPIYFTALNADFDDLLYSIKFAYVHGIKVEDQLNVSLQNKSAQPQVKDQIDLIEEAFSKSYPILNKKFKNLQSIREKVRENNAVKKATRREIKPEKPKASNVATILEILETEFAVQREEFGLILKRAPGIVLENPKTLLSNIKTFKGMFKNDEDYSKFFRSQPDHLSFNTTDYFLSFYALTQSGIKDSDVLKLPTSILSNPAKSTVFALLHNSQEENE